MIGDTVSALLSKIEGAASWREDIERVRLELNRLTAISEKTTYSDMALITDEEKASAGANFDFSGIPQGYKHLLMIGNLRGDTAASNINGLLRLNGVASANYYSQYMYGAGTTLSAAEQLATTSATLVNVPAALATANLMGKLIVHIPDYREAVRMPGGTYQIFRAVAVSSTSVVILSGGFLLNVAGAVTQITLTPAAGNWDTGSRLSLYGIG